MVRVRHRAAGARRGKLTSDPAIGSAAVALLHGLDPLTFLGLHPDDYRLTVAVVDRAQRLREDAAVALADRQAARTAGLTAQAITKWLGRALKAMSKG